MGKIKLFKISVKFGVISLNLLNCKAMQNIIKIYEDDKVNDNEKIIKITYEEEGYKKAEYKYIKKENTITTLKITYLYNYIKIIDLETNINFRRKGFATKLLLHMFNKEAIFNNGKKVLPDFLLDSTDAGHNLYKKLGFFDNGKKNVMNLQPMELKWYNEYTQQCLTLNEKNEIILRNNDINNNSFFNDFK